MIKTFFLNSTLADYGEEEFNYIQKFLLQQGILNTEGADYNDFIDLEVSQHDAGDMSVDVAIGTAVIDTERSSVSFKVFATNKAVENLVVGNNTSGNNRVDAVILKLSRTLEPNALMSNVATLEIVAGDGITALSDGDIQTAIGADYDFIRLADITVADSATQILTASITDTRVRCYNTDATVPNPTIIKFRQLSADPTTPLEGEMWYNTTDNMLRYFDGSLVINIQASVYTGGNGIDVTAGVISVDPLTNGGLDFEGGKLKVKDYQKSLQAGEAVDGSTTPVPVFLSKGLTPTILKISQSNNAGSSNCYGANWFGQTFNTGTLLTAVSKVKLYTRKTGSPSGNITVSIYATSAGLPTGSPLASVTRDVGLIGSGLTPFIFDTPADLSPNTVYAIVVSVPSGNSSNYVILYRSTTDLYAGGSYVASTNSGSSWSANTSYDFAFEIYGGIKVATGKLGKALATSPVSGLVDGFVKNNLAVNDSGIISFSPIASGFTGLTIGSDYYLSDTGTLSTTQGTIPILVGKAISATEILLASKNRRVASGKIEYIVNGTCVPSTDSIKTILGFKPRILLLSGYVNSQRVSGTTNATQAGMFRIENGMIEYYITSPTYSMTVLGATLLSSNNDVNTYTTVKVPASNFLTNDGFNLDILIRNDGNPVSNTIDIGYIAIE